MGKKTKKLPGRKKVNNPDGSVSTERSITIKDKKGHTRNIPSMFGGKQVSQREAIEIMEKNNWVDPETGRKSRKFRSPKSASLMAKVRSKALGAKIESERKK